MLVKGNKLSRRDIRNILLIQLGDIGDVVLSFPCIRALKKNFPEANIIVAVREKAKELIEDCQWATDVIFINEEKRTWIEELKYQKKFLSRLRGFRFDLTIDIKPGDRGAILAFLSGAKQKLSFYAFDGKLWRNRVFTHLMLPQPEPGQHMSQHYLSILEAYNIKTDHIWPEHHVSQDKLQKARALLKNKGVSPHRVIVAVQPFSLWKYKEWGVDKYVQLINWLISKYNVSIIITGSLDERKRADEIIEKCRWEAYNLAGETSIGTLAAVFKVCKLFIGVDSAGVHIAAAVGIPTVSIFGPSSASDWAPRGKHHSAVYKSLPCVPCKNKGCQDSEFSRCLKELTLKEVKTVVKSKADEILR
jgi:predicted lipopolysaccharide heptosyltransferase III